MFLSIIIPTHNNASTLRNTLESLCTQQEVEDLNYEIIIADNNSSDGTKELADEFCKRHPKHFRYIFEDRQGNACARNTALKVSRGDVISFTDDDCVADKKWVSNIFRLFRDPAVKAAVGKISLATPVPERLNYSLDFIKQRFAHVDHDKEGFIDDIDIVGANSHFRRDLFMKFGLFNEDDAFSVNQDTEFSRRITEGGERIFFSPDTIIYHYFSPERFKENRLLRQAYYFGRSSVYLDTIKDSPLRNFLYCVKCLFLDWLALFQVKEPSERFQLKIKIKTNLGRCYERIRTKFRHPSDYMKNMQRLNKLNK